MSDKAEVGGFRRRKPHETLNPVAQVDRNSQVVSCASRLDLAPVSTCNAMFSVPVPVVGIKCRGSRVFDNAHYTDDQITRSRRGRHLAG